MGWAPSYATVGELAAYARIGDSLDDAQIELALAAASRAIDQNCGRQFGRADLPEARYYTPRWDRQRGRWYAVIDDLATTTDLVVKLDTADDQTYVDAVTAYELRPINAAACGQPWTQLWVRQSSAVQPTRWGYALWPAGMECAAENSLRVTARWGWPGVPDPVRQACLLQARRLLARRDSPYGVAGSPDAGSEIRLLARLDPDVAVTLRPLRRVWGAV